MKKFQYVLGTVFMLSAASCSIENINETPVSGIQTIKMEFSAETPAPNTKTSIDPSADNAVYWTKDDAISVFPIGGGNYKFVLEDEGGSSSGTFAGEATEADTYYALYPYNASASLSGNTITSTLPSTQYSTADGTFDTMLSPVAGISSDGSNNFELQHIAGLLELNFTNLDGTVKEIQLKAAESMAGDYTVSLTDGTFSAAAVQSDEAVGVHLVAKDGGPLADGPYYLVLLPGTYTDVQLFITLDDGTSYMVGTLDTFEVKAGELRPQTVDASKATANNDGLYGLFMAGADIYIGGKAYNKEQFTAENIKYITNTSSAIYDTSSEYGNGKIFFIDIKDQDTPLSIGNTGDMIIIGVDPENKPRIIKTSANLNQSNTSHSRLILHNLNIDLPNSKNNQGTEINIGFVANSMFGELTLSNCDITMRDNQALIQINKDGTTISELNIVDCNINIPAGNSNRFIITAGSNQHTINLLNISNNVLYCNNGLARTFRFINSNLSTCQLIVEKLNISNNTLINLFYQNSTAGIVKELDNVSVTKNLVYYNQSLDNDEITKNSYYNFLRPITGGIYPATVYCLDNISYQQPTDQYSHTFRVFYDPDFVPGNGQLENTFRKLDVDPFEEGDLTSFTPAPEYASYGAQR